MKEHTLAMAVRHFRCERGAQTLELKPETLNPESQTLNPKS